MKLSFTGRPHFFCPVCEPQPPSSIITVVILWTAVLLVIVGAWALLGN